MVKQKKCIATILRIIFSSKLWRRWPKKSDYYFFKPSNLRFSNLSFHMMGKRSYGFHFIDFLYEMN